MYVCVITSSRVGIEKWGTTGRGERGGGGIHGGVCVCVCVRKCVCTYMYKALELRSATSRFFKKNRFLCHFPICPVSIGSGAGLKTKTRHR